MDWTFWVGAVVIVGLLIATQVFLHENRWSRRPRPQEPDEGPDGPDRSEPDGDDDDPGTRPSSAADGPRG